jgi:hypothetical protein
MKRHPLLTILMILGGLVLLLPGVCALAFMTSMGGRGGDGGLVLLYLVCLLIAVGGILLIAKAFR